ncbi:septation protein A [Sphingomonas sp. AR_OL41]|jgi:intracellular septation protein|uniref:septation protein A n=1 Tax=Sphingomonas sp. AR_OL41 TaxID=3042729 RepID=UPI00247FE604|nr:septation protein A [Sphingomonas sp. AR_OL41]MDH7972200.1 septation protein A [Sphingomonas sp. AR_OL41]
MANSSNPPPAKAGPGLRMAIDYAPLLTFFAVNFFAPGVQLERLLAATAAFMVASAIAMIVSRWKTGHISAMLWISGVLVLVFGGLTLYFHDLRFIKMKPTFVYAIFALTLIFGLVTGRPLLRQLLEASYPGLSDKGWRQLTINWALFFIGMAVLNELVWRHFSDNVWVNFKVFGAIPLTVLFALANIPMLMKHGLSVEAPLEVPPEG